MAQAVDREVVLTADGPGAPIAASFTPGAAMASFEPIRLAAEEAFKQRPANANAPA